MILILIMIMIMILLNTGSKKPCMESLRGRGQMQLERCPGDAQECFCCCCCLFCFLRREHRARSSLLAALKQALRKNSVKHSIDMI